ADLFADAQPTQLCGEASPSYSRHPRFPATRERMAALTPHAKLIYIMRHPVDRFYSNYVHDLAFGIRETIEETLRDRPWVLDTSNYIKQIRLFLEYFPREQLHLMILEDLRWDESLQSPAPATIIELLNFLGLPGEGAEEAARFAQSRMNERGNANVALRCQESLESARRIPGARALKAMLPAGWKASARQYWTETLPRTRIGSFFSRRYAQQAEPLTPRLRQLVLERLDEPTRELEELLGRNLEAWRR
ncbi:MAG: sulfotransferase domain-containing protein, partial [Planctomycetales bacterium]|nr:sulfotransferase domain-containing protein [Planctomycetales bacterium]